VIAYLHAEPVGCGAVKHRPEAPSEHDGFEKRLRRAGG